MTDDLRFERMARDWLELGPVEAPTDVLQAAFLEIDTTSQERDLRVPWRFELMNRFAIAGAAGAIAALVAIAGLSLMRNDNAVVGASPQPVIPSVASVPSSSPTESARPSPSPVVLDSTFTSSRYHYTIGTADTWSVTNASKAWVGVDDSPPAVDEIVATGTDTTITVASQALPRDQTYRQFLTAYHANTVSSVPNGCDGGDPSTWPAVTIGGRQGSWEQACNAASVLVLANERVYAFSLSNATFNTAQHLSDADFKRVLASVIFTSP